MNPKLKIVWNFVRVFWWIIVLVLAVVFFIFGGFYLLRGKKKKGESEEVESFVRNVANKVVEATTDVRVEAAIIKTKSTIERENLEDICKEPDGRKRRKRLAAILQKSL